MRATAAANSSRFVNACIASRAFQPSLSLMSACALSLIHSSEGGSMSTRQLADALHLSYNAAWNAMLRMACVGLIEQSGKRWVCTAGGASLAGALVGPVEDESVDFEDAAE